MIGWLLFILYCTRGPASNQYYRKACNKRFIIYKTLCNVLRVWTAPHLTVRINLQIIHFTGADQWTEIVWAIWLVHACSERWKYDFYFTGKQWIKKKSVNIFQYVYNKLLYMMTCGISKLIFPQEKIMYSACGLVQYHSLRENYFWLRGGGQASFGQPHEGTTVHVFSIRNLTSGLGLQFLKISPRRSKRFLRLSSFWPRG